MDLNLLRDEWIPVRLQNGQSGAIAPWQIADPAIAALEWPRMDFNIACLELLIGLVLLADPPEDDEDWADRREPNAKRLRERLARFEEAFELLGDGPRFLQDLEPLVGEASAPDMLFIDSAGEATERKNADLLARRGRYPTLDLPMAAMALYTFQAFAPAGGAGNRTSMRGGGPQVTLVDPRNGLWELVWANVPYGRAADSPAVLPWMQSTVVSSGEQRVWRRDRHPAEAFFGMPRRLRLVASDGLVTGVIQRPHGNNYAGWNHPLSPYYRMKVGDEWLPRHPPAAPFGYRHWLGVVAADKAQDGLRRRADCIEEWRKRAQAMGAPPGRPRVLVAGWAMSNMKPLDFSYSSAPFIALPQAAERLLPGLVLAADQIALALRQALRPVLQEGEAREMVREEFFTRTQDAFEQHVRQLEQGAPAPEMASSWRDVLRRVALALFSDHALAGLPERAVKDQEKIIHEWRLLQANLNGLGKYGKAAYDALDLPAIRHARTEEPSTT